MMKSKKEQILLQLQKRLHKINFKVTFLLYAYLDKPYAECMRFIQVGTDFIWLRQISSPKGIYCKQLAVPHLKLGVIYNWAWLSETSQPKLIKKLLVKGLVECLPTLIPSTSISLLKAYRIYLLIPLGLAACVEISRLLRKHILRMHILRMHLMLWHVELWILPGMSSFWLTLGSQEKEQFYNVRAFTRLDSYLAITLYPQLAKANCFTPLEVTIKIRIVPKDPPLAAYHKYKPPQKKNSAGLCMLHIHLKQLKKLLRNIKSLLPQSAKVDYTQEDLVKKISSFINIWCYLQIIFYFSHTKKQPMIVRTYSKVKFGTANSSTSTKSFLTEVKKFSCYPPGVKGLKLEALVLSLSQLKRGYFLKGGLFQLKKRISQAKLRGPLLTYTNSPLSTHLRAQRIKPKMLLALAMYFNHRYLLSALIVCRQPLLSKQTNPLLSLRGLLQGGMLLTSIWVRHTSSLSFFIRQFVFYNFGTTHKGACSFLCYQYNNESPGLTVFAYSKYKSDRVASFTLGMAENQLKKKLGIMGTSRIFIRAKFLEVQFHTYTSTHIKIKEVCIKKNKEITLTNPSFEPIAAAKQNLFVERDREAKTSDSSPRRGIPPGGGARGKEFVPHVYSISKKKHSVGITGINMPKNKNFYKYLSFSDYIIFKMVWKWCSRKHGNQSAQWIRCHYFYKLNGQSWVFALKKISFNSTPSPYLNAGKHAG